MSRDVTIRGFQGVHEGQRHLISSGLGIVGEGLLDVAARAGAWDDGFCRHALWRRTARSRRASK
jgi:hypothetical protein